MRPCKVLMSAHEPLFTFIIYIYIHTHGAAHVHVLTCTCIDIRESLYGSFFVLRGSTVPAPSSTHEMMVGLQMSIYGCWSVPDRRNGAVSLLELFE
jgi:hypothetical protein